MGAASPFPGPARRRIDMRFSVYLAQVSVRDRRGVEVVLPERRLTRRSAQDRVIATVEAPPCSRVRRRADAHGPDQLAVPVGGYWSRWLGPKVVIPAKYVLGDARLGLHGLSLVAAEAEASSG